MKKKCKVGLALGGGCYVGTLSYGNDKCEDPKGLITFGETTAIVPDRLESLVDSFKFDSVFLRFKSDVSALERYPKNNGKYSPVHPFQFREVLAGLNAKQKKWLIVLP